MTFRFFALLYLFFAGCTACLFAQPVLQLPAGHSRPVSDFISSPGGEYIFTYVSDDGIKCWEAVGGRLLYTLPGNSVSKKCFNNDGTRFVTYATDGTILSVRDTRTGSIFFTIAPGESVIDVAAYSPDGADILCSSESRNIKVFDANTGDLKRQIAAAEIPGRVTYSPDGQLITACVYVLDSQSHIIHVWDAATGLLLERIRFPDYQGWFYLGFAVGNRYLVGRSFSNPVSNYSDPKTIGEELVIYDREEHRFVATPFQTRIRDFAVSGDLKVVAAKTSQDSLIVWDIAGSKCLYRGFEGRNLAMCLALNDDGSELLFVSGSDRKQLTIMPLATPALRQVVPIAPESVLDGFPLFAFMPGGRQLLLTTHPAFGLRLLDRNGTEVAAFTGQSGEVVALMYDTKTNKVLTTSQDNYVRVWDLNTAAIASMIKVQRTSASSLMTTKYIACSNESGDTVMLLSPAAGGRLRRIAATGIPEFMSADSKYLVLSNIYNYSFVRLGDGKVITGIDPAAHGLASDLGNFVYNPAKKLVACSDGYRFVVSVWDLETGRMVMKTTEKKSFTFDDAVQKMIFDSAGRYLLTAGNNSLLQLWSLATGKAVHTLQLPGPVLSVAYGRGGQYIYCGDKSGTVYMIDAATFRIVRRQQLHGDYVYSLICDGRSNTLISAGNDGRIIICGAADLKLQRELKKDGNILQHYDPERQLLFLSDEVSVTVADARTAKELFSFTPLQKGDHIFKLPDNTYATSAQASRWLSWRYNGDVYDFDQWDVLYNRPDKVLRAVHSTDTARITDYHAAYLKRMGRYRADTAGLADVSALPLCKATFTRNTDSTVLVRISAAAQGSGAALQQVCIAINNVPVPGVRGIVVANGRDTAFTLPVALCTGRNVLKAWSTDQHGMRSLKASGFFFNGSGNRPGKVWFAGIGIRQYADTTMNLPYAAADAADMATAIGSRYAGADTCTLTDGRATRQAILALKEKFKHTGVNDLVILSVCGHGMRKGNDFYFLTHDSRMDNDWAGGVSYDELAAILDDIPARRKLLLLDACQSGTMDTAGSPDTSAQGYAGNGARGLQISETPPAQDAFILMQQLFADITAGNGAVVICAARGNEAAREGGAIPNGWFTYSVMKGLADPLADANADGRLSVTELRDYVNKWVTNISHGRQTPVTRQDAVDLDWYIK